MPSPYEPLKFIRLSEADNILVLPWGGREGEIIDGFVLNEDVPAGHKAACSHIAEGGLVVKYGHPIGVALSGIQRGDWVHEHNVKTRLSPESGLPEWDKAIEEVKGSPEGSRTFAGFRRKSGRPGVRNDLWVIPSVGCVNVELRSILRDYR